MTQVFKSYLEFISRENKEVNGVSEAFASRNKDFETQNSSNKGCWNCSGCSGCSDCSDCSGCSDCSDCSGCSDCSDCSDCSGCSDCSDCSGQLIIPKIEDIHSKVFEAVSKEGALDMSSWHTCSTTHCRAGWVVFLAGKEGLNLEKETSTLFAALQIYKKSSPEIKVSPTRFFETNKVAMKDIERCATLEAEAK